MQRNFRSTAVTTAALALLAPFGAAKAQEANAWDLAPIIGRANASVDAPLSRAALTREQVQAEVAQARLDGTFHAGTEGPTPDGVLQMRVAANQREGERIARAYREEAERVARVNAPKPQPSDAVSGTATAAPVAPSDAPQAAPMPAEPSTASPTPAEPQRQPMAPSAGGTATPAAEGTATQPAPTQDGDRSPAAPTQQPDAAVDSRGGAASSQPTPNSGNQPAPNDAPTGPDTGPAGTMRTPNDMPPAESSPVQSSPALEPRTPPMTESGLSQPAPSEAPAAPSSMQTGQQQAPAPVEDRQSTPAR